MNDDRRSSDLDQYPIHSNSYVRRRSEFVYLLVGNSTLRKLSAKREKWTTKCEFLLAVTGFVVDLGNIWRFPYICYRNGGGAFLVPYLVMFFFGGLPLFYMELALGQYHRSGCISVWKKICPIFKGIGLAICVINSYVAFFYNTIISWGVYYLFSSFTTEVPWATCNHTWNSENCSEPSAARNLTEQWRAMQRASNSTEPMPKWTSPAEDYFLLKVLEVQYSSGLNDLGSVKWELALCLMLVYFIVYFALWKGPSSAGKAVWITATLPYVVLFILFIRGITLPGAFKGIAYYLTPQWERLKDSAVWIDAATQIFFSLGPGFGVLLALASYNDFNNNCYKDAIITSVVNSLTSFLSGFVIFSVLGYMSVTLNREIDEVAAGGGPGLIFIVYPQAIATMKGAPFWAVLFFVMLISLGIDSTFGGLESIITGICDEFPNTVGRKRELFVLLLVAYCYLGGLPTATYGGNYLIDYFDHYGVSLTLLFTVFVEAIALCWFYGVRKFSQDVYEMLGFRPGFGWQLLWTAISPVFVLIIFVFAVKDLKPLSTPDYSYPQWSVIVGWVMRMSSLSLIPGYMVYHLSFKEKGNLCQRFKQAIRPRERTAVVGLQTLNISPGLDRPPTAADSGIWPEEASESNSFKDNQFGVLSTANTLSQL